MANQLQANKKIHIDDLTSLSINRGIVTLVYKVSLGVSGVRKAIGLLMVFKGLLFTFWFKQGRWKAARLRNQYWLSPDYQVKQ